MTEEKWLGIFLGFALLLDVAGAGRVFAQEAPPQICFLHLKLQSNQVHLVSASVAPGRLKVFPERRAAIDLEVASSTGQVLWTNSVADPSFRHLEFEDPDHPGQLLRKEVTLTNTEFTVRVPVIPDAHHVNFYLTRVTAETNAAGVKVLSPQAAPSPARTDLGSIVLPPSTQ